MIKIIRAAADVCLEEIKKLRKLVWQYEGVTFADDAPFEDVHDVEAVHYCIYSQNKLVASARLTVHEDLEDTPYALLFLEEGLWVVGKVAVLTRLVVHPEHRGNGYAASLDRIRVYDARRTDAVCLIVTPVGANRMAALRNIGFSEHATCSSEKTGVTEAGTVDLELGVYALDLHEIVPTVAHIRDLAKIS